MSVQAFPEYSFWKIADTSEVVLAGGFTFADNQQLHQVIPHVYLHGTLTGTEKIRSKLYLDSALTKVLDTSDWFTLSEITNIAQYWRGRIGLTFSNKPYIETTKTYYISFETTGYTRNADTFYIGYLLDDFNPVNSGLIGLYAAMTGYRIIDGEL